MGEGLALMLSALLGLAVGVVIGWLAARNRGEARAAETASRATDLQARLDERSERVAQLARELDAQAVRHHQLQQEIVQLREAQARLAAEREAERTAHAEQKTLLDQAEKRLREAFQALSAEALKSNNQSFLDLAKATLAEYQKAATGDLALRQKAIDALVVPIRESLQQVDAKLQQVEKERVNAYAGLIEQVKSLGVTQQQLQHETANLVKALRSPTVRGQWGEIQLKRVVELAGMLEHCDFDQQETVSGENGRLRPDMVVRLPGGKKIVVDAKAPLRAYLESVEATDDATREAKLKSHARQVRDHMTQLGSKNYWSQFEPTPEFVVMFLPGETFFSAALQYDPGLIEFGVNEKVILASPTTLIALLRAVAYGWSQEQLAANALQVSRLGRDLYSRIGILVEYFDDLRKALDNAVHAYNRAVGSFESRLLVAARRLKELGVGTDREVPALESIDRVARIPPEVEPSLFPEPRSAGDEPDDPAG